jgi:transposase
MIPCEHTSGKRQRLGKLTKEGNSLLCYLWPEATIHAVRKDPELKRFYRRKLIQKGMGKARIAAAPCGNAKLRQWSCIAVTGLTSRYITDGFSNRLQTPPIDPVMIQSVPI